MLWLSGWLKNAERILHVLRIPIDTFVTTQLDDWVRLVAVVSGRRHHPVVAVAVGAGGDARLGGRCAGCGPGLCAAGCSRLLAQGRGAGAAGGLR